MRATWIGDHLRMPGLVRRPQLPDQPEAPAHRRLRLGRPHDLHRLRRLLLLLQGQGQEYHAM